MASAWNPRMRAYPAKGVAVAVHQLAPGHLARVPSSAEGAGDCRTDNLSLDVHYSAPRHHSLRVGAALCDSHDRLRCYGNDPVDPCRRHSDQSHRRRTVGVQPYPPASDYSSEQVSGWRRWRCRLTFKPSLCEARLRSARLPELGLMSELKCFLELYSDKRIFYNFLIKWNFDNIICMSHNCWLVFYIHFLQFIRDGLIRSNNF